MDLAFKNTQHEHTYLAVLAELKRIGYRGQLLQEHYPFGDWFLPNRPRREAPAAAFGRFPPAYDNACFAVLVPNGIAGKDLVTQYRALGAPLALEVQEDRVALWTVGHDEGATTQASVISAGRLQAFFEDNKKRWSADSILRAKNIGKGIGARQLDFFDLHLIPALEEQIREKLHVILNEVLDTASRTYRRETGTPPDEKMLFRLVFRLLAAKILHDRDVPGFAELNSEVGAARVLQKVSQFYSRKEPILDAPETQQAALSYLWDQVGFQNLSVEVLAYVYENTLVSKSARRRLGTHSTPSSIARYIMYQLPFEEVDRGERFVVEPCCGHAVFLVAALKRLRELLPVGMNSAQQHKYFVEMLRGFELDAFAIEVGKLCLMLADFPNADGWQLENRDVFNSRSFNAALRGARFVIANPPFEDFSDEHRERYGNLRSVRKPAELLYRVLDNLHPDGSIGFVLPRQFIDGTGYGELRKLLAERFGEIDVVALPDRVFHVSQTESSLLIAKKPRKDGQKTVVSFTEVADRDRESFLREYGYTRRDVLPKSVCAAESSLAIAPLWDVWHHLRDAPRLSEFAEIHRGIEWKKFDEAVCYSSVAKPGYRMGYARIRNDLFAFLASRAEYLSVNPENLRRGSRHLWGLPKVVLNAARISRGPWRLAAFVDLDGNLCSQSFHGVWLNGQELTHECLAAILNGPVANIFVATHERGKHNDKRTLDQIPVPARGRLNCQALTDAVREYLRVLGEGRDTGFLDEQAATDALLRIDALVLLGYDLPPRLEVKVLNYVHGCPRPVPFSFTAYDVKRTTLIRLSDGTGDYHEQWNRKRTRRDELVEKYLGDNLSPAENAELRSLETDLDRYVDSVSPLPFDKLDHLEQLARVNRLLNDGEDE